MLKQILLPTLAITAFSMALGACATAPQPAPQPQTKFDTPPNWLDRVSVVAYLPKVDYDAPLPTGDYENEPSRFFFQGHPLNSDNNDNQEQNADQAAPDMGADAGGGGGEE